MDSVQDSRSSNSNMPERRAKEVPEKNKPELSLREIATNLGREACANSDD